jgi:4-oxalomesaconate tautomerase
MEGSVCQGIAQTPAGRSRKISVEHPTGEFTVDLETDPAEPHRVTRAALLRTARLLMRGDVMVAGSIWPR